MIAFGISKFVLLNGFPQKAFRSCSGGNETQQEDFPFHENGSALAKDETPS